jgi:hypothetical protein
MLIVRRRDAVDSGALPTKDIPTSRYTAIHDKSNVSFLLDAQFLLKNHLSAHQENDHIISGNIFSWIGDLSSFSEFNFHR